MQVQTKATDWGQSFLYPSFPRPHLPCPWTTARGFQRLPVLCRHGANMTRPAQTWRPSLCDTLGGLPLGPHPVTCFSYPQLWSGRYTLANHTVFNFAAFTKCSTENSWSGNAALGQQQEDGAKDEIQQGRTSVFLLLLTIVIAKAFVLNHERREREQLPSSLSHTPDTAFPVLNPSLHTAFLCWVQRNLSLPWCPHSPSLTSDHQHMLSLRSRKRRLSMPKEEIPT